MIVPQNKNCNFFMVANEVFDFKLKPREFIVYCCLLRHSDKNGICFPSTDTAIKNLEKAGLVTKQKRKRQDGSNTSNLYKVTLFR